nr:uncharacterized protein LOC112769690 [Arachis hypogaea]
MDWGRPTSVIEIRSFLGLAGYYRRFFKGFSQIALPLTRLTRKDAPFIWTPECKESFQALKQKLTTAPVLVLPEPNEPFEETNYKIANQSQLVEKQEDLIVLINLLMYEVNQPEAPTNATVLDVGMNVNAATGRQT